MADDKIVDLASAAVGLAAAENRLAADLPPDLLSLLELGATGLSIVEQIDRWARQGDAHVLPRENCVVLAPVRRPPKLVCVGLNYRGPAQATRFRPGEGAPVFLKATSTIIGCDEQIVLPPTELRPVFAEVELGVVIGATAYQLDHGSAFDYVAGYTLLLDLTAQSMLERDAYTFQPAAQRSSSSTTHIVLFRAKDFDTFTPMGPALVTRDEAGSIEHLAIAAWINGEQFVDGNTSDMLIDVPHLLEYVTSVMTLEPGDVIATGHPGFTVARPLTPGDTVRAEITSIGILECRVNEKTHYLREDDRTNADE